MFDQWRDYVTRQRELKHLTMQMISVQQKLALKQYFSDWVQQYREMKLAKHHYVSGFIQTKSWISTTLL